MNKIKLAGKTISPSKVVCIGRNYVEHIKELNNEMPDQAVIFVKPNSAISDCIVSGTDEPIHYEAEIAFVIEEGAITHVGVGLDLTKRGLQSRLKNKGLPWERAKGFDKSAVFSHFEPLVGSVQSLSMQLLINEQLIQHADYDLMIHKPSEIIDEVASFMRFENGDILMTGTPKGVGVVNKGDHFTGRIYQDKTLLIEQQWTVL
ncbi:2-keto-4-pentenoate hydratase [Psychromonas marina]|uniref:2-keto-4-pentenoate hydratase n=1 Tax=Psychromonas marina TaxID=88364 RepID=A0ABQ6DYJ2_9GAMM|nr:fumarylacetoacetate hydrolase family protein [Psychromonas marina]GLS90217.1 2-keto-4-pentenoate hydratase [Psychromonas marina]